MTDLNYRPTISSPLDNPTLGGRTNRFLPTMNHQTLPLPAESTNTLPNMSSNSLSDPFNTPLDKTESTAPIVPPGFEQFDYDDGDRLTQTKEDALRQYLTGVPLFTVCAALCLAVFCVALDNTVRGNDEEREDKLLILCQIIATAIPSITEHFQSLEDAGWYGSAYLMTTCGKYSNS